MQLLALPAALINPFKHNQAISMEQFQMQQPLPYANLKLVLGILSIVLCFVAATELQ